MFLSDIHSFPPPPFRSAFPRLRLGARPAARRRAEAARELACREATAVRATVYRVRPPGIRIPLSGPRYQQYDLSFSPPRAAARLAAGAAPTGDTPLRRIQPRPRAGASAPLVWRSWRRPCNPWARVRVRIASPPHTAASGRTTPCPNPPPSKRGQNAHTHLQRRSPSHMRLDVSRGRDRCLLRCRGHAAGRLRVNAARNFDLQQPAGTGWRSWCVGKASESARAARARARAAKRRCAPPLCRAALATLAGWAVAAVVLGGGRGGRVGGGGQRKWLGSR